MDLKRLFDADDRGVSPVIGVILMVAITVILAAVIATFVMNMGPPENTAPNTQIDITDEGSYWNLEHTGGDAISDSEVVIQVDGLSADLNSVGDEWTASENISVGNGTVPSWGADIDTLEPPSNSSTIQVIWQNPSSDETQILKEFDS